MLRVAYSTLMKTNFATRIFQVAALAIIATPAALAAQGGTCQISLTSCSVSHVVSIRMPVLASMSLSGSVALPSPSASDFTGGQATVVSPEAGLLSVRANKAYSLSVQSGSAYFEHAENKDKAASDLSVQIDGQEFVNLSAQSQALLQDAPKTSKTDHKLAYKATYRTSDQPGAYALTLTYSLSSL